MISLMRILKHNMGNYQVKERIMSDLVWHDEPKFVSWTYCETFRVYSPETNYYKNKVILYRRATPNDGFDMYIGTFATVKIAKSVAQYIMDAQNYNGINNE